MPGSAFSYRGFQLYWAARLCAAMAIQMQAVAVGWQVYELTQRPLDLGLVGLAQFLPALGLALFTGQVADRYDRRRVLASGPARHYLSSKHEPSLHPDC